MNYNHDSENNLEIQGKILMFLHTPMNLKDLIRKMFMDYRVVKNDVLRNLNYLIVAKRAVVRRKQMFYVHQEAPKPYIRKNGGKEVKK